MTSGCPSTPGETSPCTTSASHRSQHHDWSCARNFWFLELAMYPASIILRYNLDDAEFREVPERMSSNQLGHDRWQRRSQVTCPARQYCSLQINMRLTCIRRFSGCCWPSSLPGKTVDGKTKPKSTQEVPPLLELQSTLCAWSFSGM